MTGLAQRAYSYGRHRMGPEDIEAVLACLETDYLSQGKSLAALEQDVAAYCGAKYCLAVSSGTTGLHLACAAVGLGPGEIGLTTPLTFVATANAVRYTGATVDLVDIIVETYNMNPAALADKFAEAVASGKAPRAVLPVHFSGQSCDMQAISEIARAHGSYIIEDACHALGGWANGKPIGACTHSDIAVFSLHPVKSITAGEGGLVLTNDDELYQRMKRARSHGLAPGRTDAEPWVAEMVSEGFNYRITEMQCALAASQMKKLDEFIARRRELVAIYQKELTELPVTFQESDVSESACHLFAPRFDFNALGKSKRQVFDEMRDRDVTLAVHYLPVHLHGLYKAMGFREGQFPQAEAYYQGAFSLPLHPSLSDEDVGEICRRLHEVIG